MKTSQFSDFEDVSQMLVSLYKDSTGNWCF